MFDPRVPRPKSRPDPNVASPLSEPSIQRRLFAAYLAAGHTRATFARALGVSYQTVDRWDEEKSMPELPLFLEACRLVGYTPNQICGLDGGTVSPIAPPDDELSPEEADAFATAMRAYIEAIRPAFVASYRVDRAAGVKREAARSRAHAVALQHHAMATKRRSVEAAVAAGGKPGGEGLAKDLRRIRRRER